MFKTILNFFRDLFSYNPTTAGVPMKLHPREIAEEGILHVTKEGRIAAPSTTRYRIVLPTSFVNDLMTYFNVLVVPRGVFMTLIEHNKYSSTFELVVTDELKNSQLVKRLIESTLRNNLRVLKGIHCRHFIGDAESLISNEVTDKGLEITPIADKTMVVNLYQYRFVGRDVSVNHQRYVMEHNASLEVLETVLQFSSILDGLVHINEQTAKGVDIYLLD